jgi:hypothetical protein
MLDTTLIFHYPYYHHYILRCDSVFHLYLMRNEPFTFDDVENLWRNMVASTVTKVCLSFMFFVFVLDWFFCLFVIYLCGCGCRKRKRMGSKSY